MANNLERKHAIINSDGFDKTRLTEAVKLKGKSESERPYDVQYQPSEHKSQCTSEDCFYIGTALDHEQSQSDHKQ